jgi:hypothetical protein
MRTLDGSFYIGIDFRDYELGTETSNALAGGQCFSGGHHPDCVCLYGVHRGLPDEAGFKILFRGKCSGLGVDYIRILHFARLQCLSSPVRFFVWPVLFFLEF